MTCAPIELAPDSLVDAVDRAHCWAEHALAAPGRGALEGVWWLSTHLATVERVVHPVALRVLPDGASLVAEQRRRARATTRLLWAVDHAITGDARLHHVTSGDVRHLAEHVRDYAAAENHLAAALERELPEEQLRRLHHRYVDGIRRAPTRPHPLLAQAPALAAATFRMEGLVDRARDVLDSRHRPRRLAG